MLFYDTVIYAACWLFVIIVLGDLNTSSFVYMGFGYVLFTVLRFSFRVYRVVLRYGSFSAFARLVCADGIASCVLVAVNFLFRKLLPDASMSFLTLICSAAGIILIGIISRGLYCYVYIFAKRKTKLARTVRHILEHIALVDFDSDVSGATLHFVLESKDSTPVYINELQWIVDKFAIRGTVTNITQINNGYINRTYRVETLSDSGHVHKYTLQRINDNVFRDVELLMKNYKLVTDTLYGKLSLGQFHGAAAVQTLRPTKDGRSFLNDESGCWRMTNYFDNVYF